MQIIDLSLPIDEKGFEVHKVDIERITHKAGVEKFNRVIMGKTLRGKIGYLLGRRILKPVDLPDGEFLSLEIVHSPVHVGTHLDYSFHYGTRSEGRESKTADEIPLEYCYQNAVRLDLRHKKAAEEITAEDLETALKKEDYILKPFDIILIWTGADKFYGTPRYFTDYPGIGTTAIDFIIDHGVKIFGVDTMGIDRPYKFMLKEFIDSKDPAKFYPAHFYGRKREFIHIERLGNLESLPRASGFKVACFPVRIRQTGAAWSRVVALV
ncbi:MAG: Kynurenine formamidase [Candidatus Omnitrophica bacterium ADurb.Bin205]|nr:MAG: Kynurenine formamidase [Candidatus Omnitrophica bacterium ADurb.Bin205]